MNREQLLKCLDYRGVEGIVCSDTKYPRRILGAHHQEGGILIQCFFPGAKDVELILKDRRIRMEQVDESGFFAVFQRRKRLGSYLFSVDGGEGIHDPYAYPPYFLQKEELKFSGGIWYEAYRKMGAHVLRIDRVDGAGFAVWAPNARAVSVVGTFNGWSGGAHQMNRLNSGIFELFIPGVCAGEAFQYELRLKDGSLIRKSDPYSRSFTDGPEFYSIVSDRASFVWEDALWESKRPSAQSHAAPLLIYEADVPYLEELYQNGRRTETGWKQAADMLGDRLKQAGYTHILLSSFTERNGGCYAVAKELCSGEDLKAWINTLHQAGIGVLMEFPAAAFPEGDSMLSAYDGTCLYEHLDPRRGVHPKTKQHLYNYGRPEASNYLLSAAFYWIEEFHIDGFYLKDVSTMLYQDFGREDGNFVPNLYGGNENLESVEFLKHFNSILHKRHPGILTIADEVRGWKNITMPPEEMGLGFDYKWDARFAQRILPYMALDPVFRPARHFEITYPSIYAHSERYIIGFDQKTVMGQSLRKQVSKNDWFSNYKLLLAFFMTQNGKKLLYMGEDTAPKLPVHRLMPQKKDEGQMQIAARQYTEALFALYRTQKALYQMDEFTDGFEWIRTMDAEKSLLVYLRKTDRMEDTLVVICNFSEISYRDAAVGVPYPGKYKEIFNSDAAVFKGSDAVNPRLRIGKREEQDERPCSVSVTIPPLGVSVLRFIP